MKRTFTGSTIQEVEFDIPCYIKFFDNHFYKIINETQVVVVKTYNFSTEIGIQDLDQCNPFGNNGWEFTTAEEFKKAFDVSFERISTLSEFPNITSLTEPVTQPS